MSGNYGFFDSLSSSISNTNIVHSIWHNESLVFLVIQIDFSSFHVYLLLITNGILQYSFCCLRCRGGSSRLEDAVDCYKQAGIAFKMAKNWPQAGRAFCEAANLHAQAGSRHDAATNYVDASNAYKKVCNGDYIRELRN